MTLSDLASVGSFVSGIAVLVSLIYVAAQIRQAERNQRAQMQQETSSRYLEAIKHWGEPAVASAVLKAAGGEELTAMEVYVLRNQLRISLVSFQDTFLLQKQSLIHEIQLEGMLRSMRQMFAIPVMRALWNTSKQTSAPQFVEWMEANISEVPLANPIDFAGQLKVALSDVKNAVPT